MVSGTLAQSVACGFVASLLLAAGLAMMKARAPVLPMARGRGIVSAILAWIRDPVWMGGLLVQAAGYALYMIALAGAPVSVVAVAMQGGIALFVMVAVVFLGERARPWEWVGIAACLVATLLLADSLQAGAVEHSPNFDALELCSGVAATVVLGLVALPRFRQSGAAIAIASGIVLGFASLYTKPLADRLAAASTRASLVSGVVTSPYLYLTIVANVTGLVMLQNSFALARGIIAMPLSSAVSNLIPIAGGIAMFGEWLPVDPVAAGLRASAFAITIAASAALAAGEVGSGDLTAR
jgi:drug/metabolite transporter (DMT)-like permease